MRLRPRRPGAVSWRAFALPGVVWLVLFTVVPAYALLAMAFGKENFLLEPVPAWNPGTWNVGFLFQAISGAVPGGEFWPSVRNTIVYVAASLVLCFAVGYPVAYYVARHARRTKALLIVLLVIPFWVSYLLRMLAWIGLLSSDGYVNKILIDLGIGHPPDWLNGNPYSVIIALVYGYIPYFILPVFAGLDRIDQSQIEAARDLGATPWQAFRRVTLPYLAPAIAAAAMLAFTVSIDDYVITSLVAGVDSQTLPMVIYAMARRGVNPALNAISTVVVFGLGLLIVVSERLRRTT